MRRNGFTTLWVLPVLLGLLLLLLGLIAREEALRSSWYQQIAADNLASSAATLLAREMNLVAILNRALFANELAKAQVLGLASWFLMMKDVADRNAMATSWIPYLNGFTRTVANFVRNSEQPFMQILQAVLSFQTWVSTALRATQWYARISFALTLPTTMAELVKLHELTNEDGEPVTWQLLHAPGLVAVPWLWWTFIPAQASGADRQLARRLMLDSLDPFTRKRTYEWFDAIQVEAEKAGGARLKEAVNGEWSWQSMDTVSIHVRGLLDSDEYPWGDGASYAGAQIDALKASDFGASVRINPRASRWAVTDQLDLKAGAERFRYFNRRHLTPDKWPAVIVVLPKAVAKASVIYSRPTSWFARTDNKLEKANLFNALWQSQLRSLDTLERTILSARLGNENAPG